MSKQMTRQNILEAALNLFSQKGYSSITTKEIAKNALISEMTLFRHFNTKRSIFTAVVKELMHSPEMERINKNQFTWNLKEDLTMMSDMLKIHLGENSKIIKMNMKDTEGLTGESQNLFGFPDKLKTIMNDYFDTYVKKNNIGKDPEMLAVLFISSLLGLFLNYFILNTFTTTIHYDDAARQLIRMFTQFI